ncbi:MAG: hypothetical protein ACXAC6_16795 [Candidatus Hodarchaeales archaeon]
MLAISVRAVPSSPKGQYNFTCSVPPDRGCVTHPVVTQKSNFRCPTNLVMGFQMYALSD